MAAPVVDYTFTNHAIEEMRRRIIHRSDVEAVLAPDSSRPVREGRDVLQSQMAIGDKQYLLRVFVDIDRQPAEVVTVYRTSKIDKYWSALT